jgi:hypothetical protein
MREGDFFPDRLDINIVWHVNFTAMAFFAFGESKRLSGALDHSFARSWFSRLPLDSLPKISSKRTGVSAPEKNATTRLPPCFPQ